MTDHPVDTPKSLRALADHLLSFGFCHPRDTEYNSVPDAVDALRRAADRLEAPSNAAELVWAIDAARRAGAEEMRAAAALAARGMGASRNGTFPDHGTAGLPDRVHDLIVERDFAIAAAILALPLPGDQP